MPMKTKIIILIIILSIGIIGFFLMRFTPEKGPKKIVAKFSFGKRGNGLGEFERFGDLIIKDNYLLVPDPRNHRIQTLKVNPDGSLTALYSFGKKGKGLGEFEEIGNLIIKNNYIFIADNYRIQTLKINPDGSLTALYSFGKRGKGLGEFEIIKDLIIKDNSLFIVDLRNHCIQTLKINPDGSLTALYSFGKRGKGLGEFESIGHLAIKENYLFASDCINKHIQTLKINPNGSLTALYSFGKRGKFEMLGSFIIKDNYLFIPEFHFEGDPLGPREEKLLNNRLRILRINPDGSLSPKFIFGKKGKRLGQFNTISTIRIKGDYLYINELHLFEQLGEKHGSHRIQILKVNPNGSLSPKLVFGKKGEGLGEFNMLVGLAIKDNYLYVAEARNHRIQVLEIKY